MSKLPRRIFFGVGLFALALIFWAALYPGFRRQSFTFEDGSTLTLLGVTYGTNHLAPLSSWQDLVHLAPEPLRKKLGVGPRFTWRTAEPTAFAWVQPSESMSLISYRVESLDGIQHELDPARINQTPPYMVALKIPVFPRRDPAFYLLAPPKVPGATNHIRLFKIPNPAPGDYPRWQAEALPAVRQQNGYTFELSSLQLSTNRSEVRGWLRVLENGEVSRDWKLVAVRMTSDASGNTVSPKSWASWGVGQVGFVYRWPLFTGEVWKIRLEIIRLPSATFTDEELWTTPVLRVAESSDETPVNHVSHAMAGATIVLKSITRQSTGIQVKADTQPPTGDYRLDIVKAVDETGRELVTRRIWQVDPEVYYITTPDWPTSAPKRLQITFALNRPIFVDYLVEPELTGEGW